MSGTLFIVATPIGNMEDITQRAKRVLGEADVIAAEDTRTAHNLLAMLGIQGKTVSNHKFNEKSQVELLLSLLESGKSIAVVSDAGTPCISDPGGIIVSAAAGRGITVTAVPGASAVAAALSVCGFDLSAFAFYGFWPKGGAEIRGLINMARKGGVSAAVFFESPKRVKKTLELLCGEIPEAELCLCNDLTKRYERVYRGTPGQVLEEVSANPSAEKGEYALVVNLAGMELAEPEVGGLSPEAMIVDYIVRHGGTVKDAVGVLAKTDGGFPKKELYGAALRLRGMFNGDA